jgi:hypothetical protein
MTGSDVHTRRIDKDHLVGRFVFQHLSNPLKRLRHVKVVKTNITDPYPDWELPRRNGQTSNA